LDSNIEENLNNHPLKSSAAKAVRAKLVEQFPNIEKYLDEIWPKKAKVF
jgi:hypothetical protein